MPLSQKTSNPIISAKSIGLTNKTFPAELSILVKKIEKAGHSAWLVGGCLRDAILGIEPKDFDVVTDATPEAVKKIFKRRCRLIGRRFRLAHVYTQDGLVEVSTLRASEQGRFDQDRIIDESGRICADNVYGTNLEEDVWRRDFSINAMYYRFSDNSLIDYVGGLDDLKNQTIRLIGDPEQRLREDPMRMLRAVRFSAKLGIQLDDDLQQEIARNHALILSLPGARLMDETIKFFQTGHAVRSFNALKQSGLFGYLFLSAQSVQDWSPEHRQLLETCLHKADLRVAEDKSLNSAFIFAVMLWPEWCKSFDQSTENSVMVKAQRVSTMIITKQNGVMNIPHRLTAVMREIWIAQLRMQRMKARVIRSVAAHPKFKLFYDFLLLRAACDKDEALADTVDFWTRYKQDPTETLASILPQKKQPKKSKTKTD